MSSTPAQSRPVFHVPLAQLAAFREQPLVVRARDPRQLVRMLEEIAPTDLRLVQLLGPRRPLWWPWCRLLLMRLAQCPGPHRPLVRD